MLRKKRDTAGPAGYCNGSQKQQEQRGRDSLDCTPSGLRCLPDDADQWRRDVPDVTTIVDACAAKISLRASSSFDLARDVAPFSQSYDFAPIAGLLRDRSSILRASATVVVR
jgi:hypothetical protein